MAWSKSGNIKGPQGTAGVGPTGVVEMYAGTAAPSGWLLCQGQAVSRTTYSALYAVVGTKYGAGNGSSTFNLPDMRNQYASAPTDATTVGTTSGSPNHAHTVQGHTHGMSHTHTAPNHTHGMGQHTHSVTMPVHKHGLSDNGWAQSFVGAGAAYMRYLTNRTSWALNGRLSGTNVAASGTSTTGAALDGTTDNSSAASSTSDVPSTPNTDVDGAYSTSDASNSSTDSASPLTDGQSNIPPTLAMNFIIKT